MKKLFREIEAFQAKDTVSEKTKIRFLKFMSENEDCLLRSNLEGHITASAIVVDYPAEMVLLIHHKKLDKWLQPGGHCDGDADTLNVAIKEVYEETGVKIEPNGQKIIDLDIHTIPQRKEVPEHEHFDVRYIFKADSITSLVQNHETLDLKWIPFEDVLEYTEEKSLVKLLNRIYQQ